MRRSCWRDQQHGDITTVVMHDAPACASRQTVKNVLTGHARGVFQGRIEVERVAQKTDGYQMSQALLLSPHAEIDCKPRVADLRRRREVQPRRDDRRVGRGPAVLSAQPRRARGGGPLHAGPCVPGRCAWTRSRTKARAPCWSTRSRSGGSAGPHERHSPSRPFDVERIRAEFPILRSTVHGKPLVFLDSAASAQKPDAVIDAMAETMRHPIRQRAPRPALDERAHDRRV